MRVERWVETNLRGLISPAESCDLPQRAMRRLGRAFSFAWSGPGSEARQRTGRARARVRLRAGS